MEFPYYMLIQASLTLHQGFGCRVTSNRVIWIYFSQYIILLMY